MPKARFGYQFGHPRDRRWWGGMERPANRISRAVLDRIPNARHLFWVDFTADQVAFGE